MVPQTKFDTSMLPKKRWLLNSRDPSVLEFSLMVAVVLVTGFLLYLLQFILFYIYEQINDKSIEESQFVLGYPFIIISVIAISYLSAKVKARRRIALENFRIANKFESKYPKYFLNELDSAKYGQIDTPMIYSIGSNRNCEDRVSGKILDHEFNIHSFKCERGSGKNKQVYRYSVLFIMFDKEFPHIVLDSKKNDGVIRSLPFIIDKDLRIELEGDFNQYFDLYAPKGYSSDALDIVSPDFMELLMNFHTAYDVEIDGGSVFLISKKDLYTQEQISELLQATELLIKNMKFKAKSWKFEYKNGQRPELEMTFGSLVNARFGRFAIIDLTIFLLTLIIIAVSVVIAIATQDISMASIGFWPMIFVVVLVAIRHRRNKKKLIK